jgi:hypothetical protein
VRVVYDRRPTVQAQHIALRTHIELQYIWFGTYSLKDNNVRRQIFIYDVFRTTVDVLLVRATPKQTRLVCAVEDGQGQGVSI